MEAEAWARFTARLHLLSLDATDVASWADLAALLASQDARVRVFYLATSPELFGPICRNV